MISDLHVKTMCRPGEGAETCAFLLAGPDGLECAKGTGIEAMLRKRVEAETIIARGDNCPGWEEVVSRG